MIAPPLPENERQRLATLRSLKILDTPPEERFDRITRLARRVFDVPIALVSLVDVDRQWFKSCQGLEVSSTPRAISFCGHTILGDAPMIIPDACGDERFCDNPLVSGDPNIRFYAGYPLSAPDGSKLGSLCIIDRRPRQLCAEDLNMLQTLGRMIESELVAMNLATSDALTGVSNLRGFLEIGRHVLALALQFGYSLQLLLLKIPPLTGLYELHGRNEGERALVEMAQVLLTSFRASDLIGRLGEDEFGVLLLGREPTRVDPALQRMEELLHKLNSGRGDDMRITARLAAVTFDAGRHATLERLIEDGASRLWLSFPGDRVA